MNRIVTLRFPFRPSEPALPDKTNRVLTLRQGSWNYFARMGRAEAKKEPPPPTPPRHFAAQSGGRGEGIPRSGPATSTREHREIGFGLPEHARERGARLQTLEIGRQIFIVIAERRHHVAVKQRGRGGAIGEREGFAHRPGFGRDLPVDHAVARPDPRPRLLDAIGIV